MVELAADLISQIGLIGAGLLIAIEVIVMPIPSEIVLLLTGFNASMGDFSYFAAILITTLGSLTGALILYAFGYYFSQQRVEAIVAQWGKYVGISVADLTKTFNWFERYGTYLVFFGRLFPIVRSLVSIPAGLIKMPLTKFILLTAAGSALWNSIWITIGALLGDQWEQAKAWTAIIDYAVYGALLVGLFWLLRKLWQNRRAST